MNETYEKKPVIPFTIGESLHKSLLRGQQSTLLLSAGRWTLSPRATVPYARVEVPQYGGRDVTWGQTIEIPQGSQGTVTNSSYHQGDVIFDGAGLGPGFVSLPPATISIPVTFNANVGGTAFDSNQVDTRRARRAYMCTRNFAAPDGPLPFQVLYLPQKRGNAFAPGGFAFNNGGILSYPTAIFGYKKMAPLGFGSGENQEPAPGANSLAELRPMAFLDSLFVRIQTADFNGSGISTNNDIYFLVEY